MYLSKSRYCALWQCPKLLWLKQYKPETVKTDPSLQSRMDTGTEIGDLARGLFGDYLDVTVLNENGKPDLNAMKARTRKALAEGAENICEASFDADGLYCAVDILRKTPGGYAIYEVKSSTHVSYIYLVDIAYQKYVLQKCGINVTGTYIVCVNTDYVRRGELDIGKLFKIEDVSALIASEESLVEENLLVARETLASKDEPAKEIGLHCADPYECACWQYCTRELPSPSVFDIYRLNFNKKIGYYRQGIVSFRDLWKYADLNEIQRRQISFALEEQGTYCNKEGVKAFLNTLSYPLYFLDFETMQLPVPLYDGTKPYQQITFQYSLHYIECPGGALMHKEFLGESGTDTRRAVAERLIEDIPPGVCVLAYNKAFECTRIKELAQAFPDLAPALTGIRNSIKDLWDPFKGGFYYNRNMGGSFSIKSVLPALYPDDPDLDYHNLEGVHNGGEAMDIFPKIKDMPPAEAEKTRRDLLNYCKLDTYAMVKVWEKLVNDTK